MGLLGNIGNFKDSFFPYLNTNTPFDIATCTYIKGWDGKWYMYGGVAPVTGVVGRNGYYKSTIVDYLGSQLLRIYPFIDIYKLDTEQTMSRYERYELSLADVMSYDQIRESVHITNTEASFKDYINLITSVGEEKIQNKSKYTVVTPFLDRNTNKPVEILIPTIFITDSISELVTTANEKVLLGTDMEDSKSNTADLQDGRIKKRLMSAMTVWARKYGIYFFVTAHVGDKKDLDKYHPEPSQNQWLSNTDKIKAAGNNFFFLPNLLFQCGKPSPVVNKEKEPIYPLNEDTGLADKVDLNYLPIKILRNKTNFTGVVIPLIVSQSKGIDNLLTYYDFLKSKEYGLIKSGRSYITPFMENEKLTRKNIRQLGEDYRLTRALELTFQLCWINNYWNTRNMAIPIPKTVEELISLINNSDKLDIDRVLESRGYWTYREDDSREYLSLLDIVEMCMP